MPAESFRGDCDFSRCFRRDCEGDHVLDNDGLSIPAAGAGLVSHHLRLALLHYPGLVPSVVLCIHIRNVSRACWALTGDNQLADLRNWRAFDSHGHVLLLLMISDDVWSSLLGLFHTNPAFELSCLLHRWRLPWPRQKSPSLSTWYALMRPCSLRCHGHPGLLNDVARHAHKSHPSDAVPRAVFRTTVDHSRSAVLHSRVSRARTVSWWSSRDQKEPQMRNSPRNRTQEIISVSRNCDIVWDGFHATCVWSIIDSNA